MTVEVFFDHFLAELQQAPALRSYYKFLGDEKRFLFRKAYFCQRLQYVLDHIGPREQRIWDCGSGYGTTALFLALNGYSVFGNTLEFYFKEIEKRKQYWSAFGDTDLFTRTYADLFDLELTSPFDTVIVQDTLHHLEPIGKALNTLKGALSPGGRLLVVEENGSNIIQNLKLFRQRGFKFTTEYYDERLNKTILFGNENIRSLERWEALLGRSGFALDADSVQFVRFFPPSWFAGRPYSEVLEKEQSISRRRPLARKFFFFGINFVARKQ